MTEDYYDRLDAARLLIHGDDLDATGHPIEHDDEDGEQA